jgi:hypothetical protein
MSVVCIMFSCLLASRIRQRDISPFPRRPSLPRKTCSTDPAPLCSSSQPASPRRSSHEHSAKQNKKNINITNIQQIQHNQLTKLHLQTFWCEAQIHKAARRVSASKPAVTPVCCCFLKLVLLFLLVFSLPARSVVVSSGRHVVYAAAHGQVDGPAIRAGELGQLFARQKHRGSGGGERAEAAESNEKAQHNNTNHNSKRTLLTKNITRRCNRK